MIFDGGWSCCRLVIIGAEGVWVEPDTWWSTATRAVCEVRRVGSPIGEVAADTGIAAVAAFVAAAVPAVLSAA
jgi:hypothetical protein